MNVLEPNRNAYRKTLNNLSPIPCVFCSPDIIEKQQCPSLSGMHWFVIANKYPYLDGNLLIIPRRHITDTQEMSTDEKKEWFQIIEKTKKRLSEIFQTSSFNISINIGEYSGQSITHLHWQILPRLKQRPPNALNIFADLHIISISPEELVHLIEAPEKEEDRS